MPGCDAMFGPRAGIAAHTLGTGAHLQRAKACQLDRLALHERVAHQLEHAIGNARHIGLGERPSARQRLSLNMARVTVLDKPRTPLVY